MTVMWVPPRIMPCQKSGAKRFAGGATANMACPRRTVISVQPSRKSRPVKRCDTGFSAVSGSSSRAAQSPVRTIRAMDSAPTAKR